MKYHFLTQQEIEFISKTEKMVEKIRQEFADEIKYIESCNKDLVQIYVSKDFLDSVLEISENKDSEFIGQLGYFLEQEYFIHLNYILCIIFRLFDNPDDWFSLSKIKNSIESKKGKTSVKELIEFFSVQNNQVEINKIDRKIIQQTINNGISYRFTAVKNPFPNLLYLNHVGEFFKKLEVKYKEVNKLYIKLKLNDLRNNYLAHNLKSFSFAEMRMNFYLNDEFVILLRELENLLDLFYLLLSGTQMHHKYGVSGYSVKYVFKKLETITLNEIKARKINSNNNLP